MKMNALELRIPPLALVVIFALAMAGIAWLAPADMPIPHKALVAAGLVSAGAVVAIMGVADFRRHKTTVNPFTPDQSSTLVSTGIYRYSRNPMYLGFLLALAGWCVYLASWGSMLLLPLFILYMNRFQIAPEERALHQHFGQQFTTYTQAVRRWL